MKKLTLLIGFLILTILSSHAQETWAPTAHVIPAKGYEGSHYRLQVSMRAEVDDDSASARAWIRVDKRDGMISLENMWDRPVRKKEWETQGTGPVGRYSG